MEYPVKYEHAHFVAQGAAGPFRVPFRNCRRDGDIAQVMSRPSGRKPLSPGVADGPIDRLLPRTICWKG